MSGLIPGLRFKPKIREDKIDFLDTMVTIGNGYLITSPYSKPMDSKLYLIPSSVDKEKVVDNIPKTVGMRLRRLCSDRVEEDRIFAAQVIQVLGPKPNDFKRLKMDFLLLEQN